tara:strand:+ start:343 stop:867 length:525 start_codon:yes stop_codon:yes gene_type:complete
MDYNESLFWQKQIREKTNWERPSINFYGNNFKIPRLVKFFSENGITYKYSGINHKGVGWPKWFSPLVNKINNYCEIDFNGCLLNLYRNGKDCMGWHSDNEPEINSGLPIVSLSLGESRDLLFRDTSKTKREKILLSNGDLLIMNPTCQSDWQHSLPRREKIFNERINLTFRCYY